VLAPLKRTIEILLISFVIFACIPYLPESILAVFNGIPVYAIYHQNAGIPFFKIYKRFNIISFIIPSNY